jgi:hypothetical protein
MVSVHIPFSINGDVGTHGSHGPIPYGQGGCPSPFFFFFCGTGFELRVYTLSHSTSPFL